MREALIGTMVAALVACAQSNSGATSMERDAGDAYSDAGGSGISEPAASCVSCPGGFHCEFGTCVSDQPAPSQPSARIRDPLASNRFVFALELDNQRLVRIDSGTLEVAAFAAGLSPMDLAIIGSRELSVLLDAYDLVEVLDHREEPPIAAAWGTAQALSHLAAAPSGDHVIAYFDWDDPRAQERQSEPGNINQVTVLALHDAATPFSGDDARQVNVAVGFLPRDIRFSADGERAVVISRDTLTPISLLTAAEGVAAPEAIVEFDGSAAEILIDSNARFAVLRYADSNRIEVLDLESADVACLAASGVVTDIALRADDSLLVASGEAGSHTVAAAELGDATPEPCAEIAAGLEIGAATHLAVDPAGDTALGYIVDTTVESIWHVDLGGSNVTPVRLEKAVAGVAFAGDGRYVLLAHMKLPGNPAWDPAVEDPDVSVDKSYGVSWLDLATDTHRLAVSDVPFGPFTFVPPGSGEGATYQAVLDARQPQLLRVSHRPGFDDKWLDLAAMPETMGYLPATGRAYVTQSHPWGRVTFIDPTGDELRHVTGFALEER